MNKGRLGLIAAGLLLGLSQVNGAAAREADEQATLWRGGTIITMDGPAPRTVQTVVERGGKIVFAGPEKAARRKAGKNPATRDLKGATMLPGFVDAHSHFAMMMQVATGIDFDDPALGVRDVPSLLAALKSGVAARQIPPGSWVVGWNYNDTKLAEKRHVTSAELSAALPGYKVVLIHFTGHGLVANDAVLELSGVNDATPNPPGGLILRDAAGKPTGAMFETAMNLVAPKIPQPTPDQRLTALVAAQQHYASRGYTHAQDGATQPPEIDFLRSPAATKQIKIDIALLPYHGALGALQKRDDLNFGTYQGHVKLQGIKFVLDGSPQARTAYFTQNYAQGSPEGHHPWHGQSNMTEADFLDQARQVHARGWQLFVHANGDAAIDMAIKGFDALGMKAKDNRRPVVIHSQFQRPDQLSAYARIGVGPAYFTNHTHYFADIHRTNFPSETVDFISPVQSALKAGLHPSNHSDAPVTRLEPFVQLWSSMARSSLTGVVSGADQRLSAYQALQMLTTGPAWQVFEENRKGRIKPGLLADFVVLDRNPLTTPVDQIRSIRVLETVKEGETVWKRAD